jgi:hypothetical protein
VGIYFTVGLPRGGGHQESNPTRVFFVSFLPCEKARKEFDSPLSADM